MSRNELVEAYLEGKISRRGFIRGMAATGASLTMAAAAADQLRVSAQDGGDDSGDGGGDGSPYGPYQTPTVIASPTQVAPSPTDSVVLPTGTAEVTPTQVIKKPKTPVVKATEAPKTGGGSTSGGGSSSGGSSSGGGSAAKLPDTGTGQQANTGGILTPISLAASAAAAAIAFRVRKLRKPAESESEF